MSTNDSSAIAIDIAVECDLWQGLPEAEALIDKAITASVREAGLRHAPGAELSIVLTNDADIRAINAQWRGIDKPTNVLSFPQAQGAGIAVSPMLGDIILAFETVMREAGEAGISLADHVSHLIIHGLLHLFGYDHITETEAQIMEELEIRILASLGIANPYAGTTLLRDAS